MTTTTWTSPLVLGISLCLTGCSGSSNRPTEPVNPAWASLFSRLDLKQLPPAAAQKDLSYANDIRPILEGSCFGCHGEQRQRGGLRLDSLEALLQGGENGGVLSRGRGDHSILVVSAAQLDNETAMPPKRGPGRPGGRRPGGPGGFGGMRPGGPGGPDGPGGMPPGGEAPGGPGTFPPPEAPAPAGGPGGFPPPEGPNGGPAGFPPGGPGGFSPPQPLTPEQVGVLRAWIDQGAR